MRKTESIDVINRSGRHKLLRLRTLTLAFPSNDNYGAYLQAWALCYVLNGQLGIDAKCLRFYAYDLKESRRELGFAKRIRNRIINRNVKGLKNCAIVAVKEVARGVIDRYRVKETPEKLRRRNRFDEFAKTFQDLETPICWNYQDLSSVDADAFLVGSDWVWLIDFNYLRKGFFGGGGIKTPFYSYAASFGINPNTPEKLAFVKP